MILFPSASIEIIERFKCFKFFGGFKINSTGNPSNDSSYWNNTASTNSVFSVGTANTVNGSGDYDPNGVVAQGWTPGVGFDNSHTGYNAHSKGIVKEIEKSVVSKVIRVTFGNDPEETFGDYDNFSVTMTPDNLIQMSHDVGFECGIACPHISWKSYDLEFNDINKPDMGKLSVGDLGYRTPIEYEPLPKDFYGAPDYLDEMRIDDIEELEGEFEVYHIIEAESATMMFANNTILHVGIN